MNKKIKKTLMSILGLAAVVVPTSMVLTSCGDQQILNKNNYSLVQNSKNKPTSRTTNNQETIKPNTNINESIGTTFDTNQSIVLNPNINNDAIGTLQNAVDKYWSKKMLQNEFDNIITNFYKTYEYESEQSGTEDEADISSITVTNPGKWNETTSSITGINLSVKWKIESESNRDNEIIKFENKEITNFELRPTFATYGEIEKIIKNVKNKDDQSVGGSSGQGSIDLDDIYDLYVGEDGKPSIFDKVLATLSKDKSKDGGLIGWNLDLSKITYSSKARSKKPNQKYDITNVFSPSHMFNETVMLPENNGNITITPDKPTTPPTDQTPSNPGGSGTENPTPTPPTDNQTPSNPQSIDLSLKLDLILTKTFDEISKIQKISSTSVTPNDQSNSPSLSTKTTETYLIDLFTSGPQLSNHINSFKITKYTPATPKTTSNPSSSFVSKDILNEECLVIDIKFNGNLNINSANTRDVKVASVCIPKSWCKVDSNNSGTSSPSEKQ